MQTLRQQLQDDSHGESLRILNASLLDPLYNEFRGRGLHKFHMFILWSRNDEIVAEQTIMGPRYDSKLDGKPESSWCLGWEYSSEF